jgi:hypothetical protein
MRKIIPVFIFFFASAIVYGQQTYADTSAMAVSTAPAKFIYDAERGDESGIYNGILYYSYSSRIEGIPFFKSTEWQKGTVLFDNVFYKDIFMRYELVNDQLLVVRDTSSGVIIALFSPRVKKFSFSGMEFIRLVKTDVHPAPENGFYRIMVKGKITALERSVKTIEEKIDVNVIERKFLEKVRYYMFKDGTYSSVSTKNHLLNACKDHKKEVQQFLSRNKLKYRRDPEKTIVAVADFYNHL